MPGTHSKILSSQLLIFIQQGVNIPPAPTSHSKKQNYRVFFATSAWNTPLTPSTPNPKNMSAIRPRIVTVRINTKYLLLLTYHTELLTHDLRLSRKRPRLPSQPVELEIPTKPLAKIRPTLRAFLVRF